MPVTNPSIPNFNLEQVFKSFGYDPTQEQIDALAPAFGGTYNMDITGKSAIANFVFAMNQLEPAQRAIQGNLLSEQEASTASQNLGKILEQSGQAAYDKAAAIFTQAPKLFGSLTPDQIDQYIAPITAATEHEQGALTGAMAGRGLGGSSIEANAMAQANNSYKEQVLSTGLGIGQQQQQQQANALLASGAQQYGAGQQQYGLGAQYAGMAQGSAGQNADISALMAGLPSQFANQALGQNAAMASLRPQNSSPWGGILGAGLGAGLGAFGGPMGMMLGSTLGGQIGSAATGNPTGATMGNSLGNAAMLQALLRGQGMGGWNWGMGSGTSGSNASFPQGTFASNNNYGQPLSLTSGLGSGYNYGN